VKCQKQLIYAKMSNFITFPTLLDAFLVLSPTCTRLHERLSYNKKSDLVLMRRAKAYSSFMLAGCLGLSSSISLQLTLEMCAAAKNRKTITKTPKT